MNLAVLVSGRGSNLRAIVQAIDEGTCRARIACVIADRDDTQAVELAASRGIATRVVRAKDYDDRARWDRDLCAAIESASPDLVVLAGFMRIVGPLVLARFAQRLINVHPALLPAFPGLDAPGQAIKKRVTVSGCTVHLVDDGIDTGPILAQAVVPVLPGDDAASLHARIQVAEHRLLPAVIDAVASGAYELEPVPRYVGHAAASDASFVWPPLLTER